MQIKPDLIEIRRKIFFSQTALPRYTKHGRNGSCAILFQNCVRQSQLPCRSYKKRKKMS